MRLSLSLYWGDVILEDRGGCFSVRLVLLVERLEVSEFGLVFFF